MMYMYFIHIYTLKANINTLNANINMLNANINTLNAYVPLERLYNCGLSNLLEKEL